MGREDPHEYHHLRLMGHQGLVVTHLAHMYDIAVKINSGSSLVSWLGRCTNVQNIL